MQQLQFDRRRYSVDLTAQSIGPQAQMQKYKVLHGFTTHSINLQLNSLQRTNEELEPDLEEAKDRAAQALTCKVQHSHSGCCRLVR